ncbi:MAG: A/G-specific adenine glycosylase [Alphaproteobacteria bacterium]|jgi:A/G-specific adenine glycosylase|nr:A/G-specific adenine glycosylase [Alphaproteobacteria bacterium]
MNTRNLAGEPAPSADGRRRPPPRARDLLAWYDRDRRSLPWRSRPGRTSDPYHVWLSEIMLQQTTTAAAAPYFRHFVARWPSVAALAEANVDEVMAAWAGLGYYARARNLHKAAGLVLAEHGGRLPVDEAGLRRLPGIGPYTGAAIAAIAFDRPAVVVDGNVERVMARLFAIEVPLPAAKPRLRERAAELTPGRRPGDYAQAVMDLGATVCTPRRPRCERCPWRRACAAHGAGLAETLPRRAPKPARPLRHGVVFWIERADGAILLRRRPARGLLGGMMELPTTPWRGEQWPEHSARAAAPLVADWEFLDGVAHHGFTHFRLELRVAAGRAGDNRCDGLWVRPERLGDYAVPSVMRKVVALARAALNR